MLEYINERHIITEEITNNLNGKVYRIYDRDTLDMKKTSISDWKYSGFHWGMSTMRGSNFKRKDDRVIYQGGGKDWTVDMVNSDIYIINIKIGEKILIDENVRSFKDTHEFPEYDFRRSVNNWWNETLIYDNRIYYNNDWN